MPATPPHPRSFSLGVNSTTSSSDGRTIDVDIQQAGGSAMDLDSIKLERSLAMSASESWLWFSRFMAHDCASTVNRVMPAYSENATAVSTYTADATAPSLLSYDLDMDSGLLTLTFDEAVDAYAFDVTQISFQASATGGTSVTLTEASELLTETSQAVMEVLINTAKLQEIYLEDDVCASPSSTYLVMTADVTTDVAGYSCVNQTTDDALESCDSNSFGAISSKSATAVDGYTYDTTSPNLGAFSLDMDSGELSMHFDEPVDVSTLSTSEITIQYRKYVRREGGSERGERERERQRERVTRAPRFNAPCCESPSLCCSLPQSPPQHTRTHAHTTGTLAARTSSTRSLTRSRRAASTASRWC